MNRILLTVLLLSSFFFNSFGQEMTKESVDVDEIEVGVKSVRLSPKGDSVTVELILQSYLKTPRELKINSFATGVISPQGSVVFYDSMSIGNVKVQFKDRQNYIHYLLTRDVPVLYVIKTPNWQKRWGKPQQFRFTLEDHEQEGKFLQVDIDL